MYHRLTEQERYTVALLKRQGQSMRSIARYLGRHPSTISREIERNRCHANDGAYPHHPWQRGSNENFNGPLQRYFPKRRSLVRVRQRHCDVITRKLNNRPRKRHDYKTPLERLAESLGVLHFEC